MSLREGEEPRLYSVLREGEKNQGCTLLNGGSLNLNISVVRITTDIRV